MKEFKDVFAWTYKNLKGIPLELAQHNIKLDIIISLVYQTKYILNPNYAKMVKQDTNKLVATRFIKSIEETTWLSPIVVVPKKNGKLRICIDFIKLNVATKKDPYPLPFTNEMLNTLVGYEAYFFLDGYSRYHQITIAPKDIYKTAFVID